MGLEGIGLNSGAGKGIFFSLETSFKDVILQLLSAFDEIFICVRKSQLSSIFEIGDLFLLN